MIAIFALIAVATIAGTALSSVAIVSMGVRREEKAARRITTVCPGSVASGARAVTGLGVYRATATWD